MFIETPYRNQNCRRYYENCKPHTQLCIAMNISCDDEWIVTKSVKSWKGNLPDMQKTPTVFLIYRGK